MIGSRNAKAVYRHTNTGADMGDSASKKILDSVLVALLKGLELSPWVKVPATFVAELSSRFKQLPDTDKKAVVEATDTDISTALSQPALNIKDPQPVAESIHEQFRGAVHQYVRRMAPPAVSAWAK